MMYIIKGIKKTILMLILFCMVAITHGQSQISQGGFENWSLSAQSTFEEPTGGWWTSLNSLRNLGGPVTVEKTSDAHSGNFAARLESKQWGTFILPGLLVSGKFVTTAPFIIQGQPFTDKPVRFKGYYKYTSVNSDSAAFFAMITTFNTVTGKRDTIADAKLAIYNTVNVYTAFDIAFNYYDNIAIPDSIDVVFSSSAGGQDFLCEIGSTLFIDDVMLEYSSGIIETLFPEIYVRIYPNPASELISIELEENVNNGICKIISMDGKIAQEFPINNKHFSVDVSKFAKGKYIINIFRENLVVSSKKFEVIH